ncbi:MULTISPECIES: hypothetical protein [unclassified Phyllobacterium]|uniref:hypothetical protein n=1 Tax=unclassified Phyllobacterium TaxID=2638441 RepID=UPI003012DF63
MSLIFTIENAAPVGVGMWIVELPPHQVRFLGGSTTSVGSRSIIVVNSPIFDLKSKSLKFAADQATALNVGTKSQTIAIAAEFNAADQSTADYASRSILSPGDRQFLGLVNDLLPTDMRKAAQNLLDGVRSRFAGNLKRGQKNNFSETPDNFWYVIVQPQVRHLQITVRGDVDHFAGISNLPILDDRGNTRFKVTGENDVPDALKLIFHAKRKK